MFSLSHPALGDCMQDAYENIMDEVIDYVIEDVCFESHRALKLGYFPVHNHISIEPLERYRNTVMAEKDGDIFFNDLNNEILMSTCPFCSQKKAAHTLIRHMNFCNGINDSSIDWNNDKILKKSENNINVGNIVENGVTENGVTENGVAENGVAENGVAENGVAENGVTENGVAENGVAENGVIDDRVVNGIAATRIENDGFENGFPINRYRNDADGGEDDYREELFIGDEEDTGGEEEDTDGEEEDTDGEDEDTDGENDFSETDKKILDDYVKIIIANSVRRSADAIIDSLASMSAEDIIGRVARRSAEEIMGSFPRRSTNDSSSPDDLSTPESPLQDSDSEIQSC